MRLYFDYGHGGRDSGAIYKERREAQDNLLIGKQVAALISGLGIEVGESRKQDVILGLKERVDQANRGGYDYFISFHRNAFRSGQANGAETFVYLNPSVRALDLAQEVQRALVKAGFKNRGVKRADYYVLRKSKMPAILIEIGFIDSPQDNLIFDRKRGLLVRELAGAILMSCLKAR